MISKTKISRRKKRKNDKYVVETISIAKKNKAWIKIAQRISGSRKKYSSVNLSEIDKQTKEGDTIIVSGKVLGSGSVNKKIKVCSLYFSEAAREKLKSNKSEIVTILDEIKKNPKAEGLRIIE